MQLAVTNMSVQMICVLFFVLVFSLAHAKVVEIHMPGVSTHEMDGYLAHAFKLEDDHRFITGIRPLTNANIAYDDFIFCYFMTSLTYLNES